MINYRERKHHFCRDHENFIVCTVWHNEYILPSYNNNYAPKGFGQQNMKPIHQIYYSGQGKIGSHPVKSGIGQKIPHLDNRCNNISPSVTNHLELAYLAEES